MRVFTDAAARASTHRAPNGSDHAERNAAALEHGSLLDVKLEIPPEPSWRQIRATLAHGPRIGSSFLHMAAQRSPGTTVDGGLELRGGQQAERGAAADVAVVLAAVPCGQLLGTYGHHRYIARWNEVLPPKRDKRRHAGDDPGKAIVIAASRH